MRLNRVATLWNPLPLSNPLCPAREPTQWVALLEQMVLTVVTT